MVIDDGPVFMYDGLVMVRLFDYFFRLQNLTMDHLMVTGLDLFFFVVLSTVKGSLMDSALVERLRCDVMLSIVVVVKLMVGLVVDMELNICVLLMIISFGFLQVKRFLKMSRSTFVLVGLSPMVSWVFFSADTSFLFQLVIQQAMNGLVLAFGMNNAVFRLLNVQKTIQAMLLLKLFLLVGGIQRFKFNDHVTASSVYVGRVEDAAVSLESTTSLVPAARIKCVEIVFPVGFKLLRALVVREDLNIVIKDVPRHVSWVETFAPGVERGCPEVHAQ